MCADASVAAGPVGRQAQAGTDEELKAEIFSYSRARGLFAGVAIDGSVLSIDHGANRDVYGPQITPRMLFENRLNAPAPLDIVSFRDQLTGSPDFPNGGVKWQRPEPRMLVAYRKRQ